MDIGTSFGDWIFAFVLLAIVLGGAAAWASGRAVARLWTTFAIVPFYVLALTAGVGFLHYALFGLPAIPAGAIGAAIVQSGADPVAALAALGHALRYAALIYVVLFAFAALGHRASRSGQMARQYGFFYERAGPFGWRPRQGR